LNEVQEPKVADFRKHLQKTWSTRAEEVMCKLGSILSAGILDAGGRNATICLHRHGNNKMRNIVGLALFTQYWFWYPYLHFLSLSLEPTSIIGLNTDLKMPSQFTFKSNQKPSIRKKEVTVGPVAELSLSAKARVREERKRRRPEGSATPLLTPLTSTPTPQVDPKQLPSQPSQTDKDTKKQKKKKEPTSESLTNPARVTPSQLNFISFDTTSRYVPIKLSSSSGINLGINVLSDTKPGEDADILTPQAGQKSEEKEENEPQPPASFEWN
ncbi:predicted protein, partial [Naegleria gruberi]